MILVGAAFFVIGVVNIMLKRNMVGVLVGGHLVFTGLVLCFVFAGGATGGEVQAQEVAFFILLSGVAQVGAGLVLALKIFELKKGTAVEELKDLKN